MSIAACCSICILGILATNQAAPVEASSQQAAYSQAAVTKLAKVKNVKVKKKGEKYVTLRWKKVKKAKKYRIQVRNKNKKLLKTVTSKKHVKKIKKLTAGKTYNFRVRAVRNKVKGKWSKYKKVKTNSEEEEETPAELPTIDFANSSISYDEDIGETLVQIALSAAATETVSVEYAMSDGTATAGTDYQQSSGLIQIEAGQEGHGLRLQITDDSEVEEDETLTITLSNPTNATLANVNNPLTVTIQDNDTAAADFTITSPAFEEGSVIPTKYTCDAGDGIGVNPELAWENAPDGMLSFVLIVRDVDAPGGEFFHWVVNTINATATGVDEDSVPVEGTQLPNDWSESSYGGPCPPIGETHTYQFEIYALSADVSASTVEELETNMAAHIVDQATLTGEYGS